MTTYYNTMSVFNANGDLTNSLSEIVSQLNKPINDRVNVNANSISSYLNFTQVNGQQSGLVQPVQVPAPTTSSDQQYKSNK